MGARPGQPRHGRPRGGRTRGDRPASRRRHRRRPDRGTGGSEPVRHPDPLSAQARRRHPLRRLPRPHLRGRQGGSRPGLRRSRPARPSLVGNRPRAAARLLPVVVLHKCRRDVRIPGAPAPPTCRPRCSGRAPRRHERARLGRGGPGRTIDAHAGSAPALDQQRTGCRPRSRRVAAGGYQQCGDGGRPPTAGLRAGLPGRAQRRPEQYERLARPAEHRSPPASGRGTRGMGGGRAAGGTRRRGVAAVGRRRCSDHGDGCVPGPGRPCLLRTADAAR